ncbi:hypothetical protein [Azospirillum sp. ST 5-10]|uniref:hypothetical protein n=1 Tax=unclassified Azospirillum TaxID=2630922 RepID=UPI003F4A36AD
MTSDTRARRPCLAAVLLLAAGVLAGCDENERGRPLHVEKGVYAGRPDTPLTDGQRDALRARTQRQHY